MISSKTRRKVEAARLLYIERRQPSETGVYLGWKHSRNLEREDILREGAIWDGQKMKEIAR